MRKRSDLAIESDEDVEP